jgi:hypothetical protein
MAQAPIGAGELGQEALLDGGLGLEFVLKLVEQGVIILETCRRQDGIAGAESVGDGVGGRDGLALGRLRSGAAGGVAAVGLDLALGCHLRDLRVYFQDSGRDQGSWWG